MNLTLIHSAAKINPNDRSDAGGRHTMFGTLQKDIQAVSSLAGVCPDCYPAVLELPGGNFITFSESTTADGFVEETSDRLANALPSSRIAMILGPDSRFITGGGWARAAAEWADDEICAVLVLQPALAESVLGMEPGSCEAQEWLCRQIPEPLWERRLPILHDADGVLSRFSPNSTRVSADSRLMFATTEELLSESPREMCHLSGTRNATAPAVDVTGLETFEALIFAESAMSCLSAMSTVCRNALGKADIYPTAPYGASEPTTLESLIDYLAVVFDETGIASRLRGAGAVAHLMDLARKANRIPYAMVSRNPLPVGLKLLKGEAERMEHACLLLSDNFVSRHVRFEQRDCPDDAAALADLARLFGVREQMTAMDAGVPVEDLMA